MSLLVASPSAAPARRRRVTTAAAAAGGGGGGTPGGLCGAPISAADISTPTTVVGNGSAGSCTEAALVARGRKGRRHHVQVRRPGDHRDHRDSSSSHRQGHRHRRRRPASRSTAAAPTRILNFNEPQLPRDHDDGDAAEPDARARQSRPAPCIPPAPAPCSQGFDLDGGGAGDLRARRHPARHRRRPSRTTRAASLGPDVGGGGIYVNGSLGVVVVGQHASATTRPRTAARSARSTRDLDARQQHLHGNTGDRQRRQLHRRDVHGQGGESGNGGNAGAVGIDGGADGTVTICGDDVHEQQAGALGGAIGRTPDNARRPRSSTAAPSTATRRERRRRALLPQLRPRASRRRPSRTTPRRAPAPSRPTAPCFASSTTPSPATPRPGPRRRDLALRQRRHAHERTFADNHCRRRQRLLRRRHRRRHRVDHHATRCS